MKLLRPLALVALAFPATAQAGQVAVTARDVAFGSSRSLASAAPTQRFNMLGVHWRGSGAVEFRTHRIHGAWSGWKDADADAAPDLSSPERRAAAGWHAGNLVWTGGSDAVQYRTRGRVTKVRAYYVWSRVTSEPLRRVQLANAPPIVTRAGWRADEKIRRAKPVYAPAIRYALIHHTAGSNSYTAEQSAAIVRGIELYHVKGNGWNDVGYNFLVDKYGQVFEGRYGGMERNVIGAHSQGFNTGSIGIALIGNNARAAITAAQRQALVQLLAWRLDVAHVDPSGTVAVSSGGNPKFRAGKQVVLRVISGHRDTYPTECPGGAAYGQLGSIAAEVAKTGLPKLFAPVVTGTLGKPVRFQARLSSSLPWSVTVTNALGAVVARGSGRSPAVDWTWSSPATGCPYAWTMEGTGLRSATGALGGTLQPPPPTDLLTGLRANPAVVTRNPDGSGDNLHLEFALSQAAAVTVALLDAAGTPLQTISSEQRAAGANTVDWSAAQLADGRYKATVTATGATGATASSTVDVVVDRSFGGFAVAPAAISPNGDGVNDTLTASFTLNAALPVKLEIRSEAGAVVATILQTTLDPGPHVVDWDGAAAGMSVPDGSYSAVLTVTDALGEVSLGLPFAIDLTAPVLKIVDARNLRFSLTEPAIVTLLVNGRRVVKAEPKGAFAIPRSVVVTSVSGMAVDGAGNPSPLVRAVVRTVSGTKR